MDAPRPAGVPWLTPYLTVRDAHATIAFFETAFGFRVRDCVQDDGAIMHVEMTYQQQLIVMFAPEGAFGSAAQAPSRRSRFTCTWTTSTARTPARWRPGRSR